MDLYTTDCAMLYHLLDSGVDPELVFLIKNRLQHQHEKKLKATLDDYVDALYVKKKKYYLVSN